jgi:hypothetical protein
MGKVKDDTQRWSRASGTVQQRRQRIWLTEWRCDGRLACFYCADLALSDIAPPYQPCHRPQSDERQVDAQSRFLQTAMHITDADGD